MVSGDTAYLCLIGEICGLWQQASFPLNTFRQIVEISQYEENFNIYAMSRFGFKL